MSSIDDVRRAARDLADAQREVATLESSLCIAVAEAVAMSATDLEIAEALQSV